MVIVTLMPRFVAERDLRDYSLYGTVVTEVELDSLTGEHRGRVGWSEVYYYQVNAITAPTAH
ncbi:hypothetical protein J6590_031789 [Homalodisca vitripennis]|nr:hypothetical protein J6590_031789 [Homalodisca vitripennis]